MPSTLSGLQLEKLKRVKVYVWNLALDFRPYLLAPLAISAIGIAEVFVAKTACSGRWGSISWMTCSQQRYQVLNRI